MEIVTTVCVDSTPSDSQAKYLMLPRTDSRQRRVIYWKCAVVFFSTSMRCNPGASHRVFTNDTEPVIINGTDIRKWLSDRDIKITYLPFQKFVAPIEVSKLYRNALYRPEALSTIANDSNGYTIFLDSDCLWTKPDQDLIDAFHSNELLLLDLYEDPKKKIIGMSRVDMGNLFSQIESDYPEAIPHWFGGEIIGGKNSNLYTVAKVLEKTFQSVLSDPVKLNLRFPNGLTFFDGDEPLISFVYSKNIVPWRDARRFIRRVWTIKSRILPEEFDATIWHLPWEKKTGFELLFSEVLKFNSKFWTIPIEKFKSYLGEFVGVPYRKHFNREYFSELTKAYVRDWSTSALAQFRKIAH